MSNPIINRAQYMNPLYTRTINAEGNPILIDTGNNVYNVHIIDDNNFELEKVTKPYKLQVKSNDPKEFQKEMFNLKKSFLNEIDSFASDLAYNGFTLSTWNKNKFQVLYSKCGTRLENFFEGNISYNIKRSREYKVLSPDLLIMINDYQLYRKKHIVELIKKYYDNTYFSPSKRRQQKKGFKIPDFAQALTANVSIGSVTSSGYIYTGSTGIAMSFNDDVDKPKELKTRRVAPSGWSWTDGIDHPSKYIQGDDESASKYFEEVNNDLKAYEEKIVMDREHKDQQLKKHMDTIQALQERSRQRMGVIPPPFPRHINKKW